jgi:hypothetical protein
MRQQHAASSWVVYERTFWGKPQAMNVVCEQGEWDALERETPGAHTLVRAGFANEGEAERHARAGTAAPHLPTRRKH